MSVADGVSGPIGTREQLKSYDPGLHDIIHEVLVCDNDLIDYCHDKNQIRSESFDVI